MDLLTALLIAIGLVIALGYTFKFIITGGFQKSYWPSRSVYQLDMDKVIPFWKRITLQTTFMENDQKMYEGFQGAGITDYGGLIQFGSPVLVLLSLELIRAVLVKDFDHFVNRRTTSMELEKVEPVFHNMLLNQTGEGWKELRATLSPTFTTGKIRRMFDIFGGSSVKLVQYIQAQLRSSSSSSGGSAAATEIDIVDPANKITIDVIASAAFGLDSQVFQEQAGSGGGRGGLSAFGACAKKFQNTFAGLKIFKLLLLFMFPKLLSKLNVKIIDQEALAFFKSTIEETIKWRKESGEKRDDFLQLLIEAQEGELAAAAATTTGVGAEGAGEELVDVDTFEKDAELKPSTGGAGAAKLVPLTDDIILSQCLLFFAAGSDTTTVLIIYALYELALNPDVQETLYQEVSGAMGKGKGKTNAGGAGALDYETLNSLNYLDMFVSEVLRKYPPGIRAERTCTTQYKLPDSELVLDKGQVVVVPVYAIHHDEQYFPNPSRFDPERFNSDNKAARHPYAYMPFGHGPRNCIARRFALVEGKTVIAHLVNNFMVEPCGRTKIPPIVDVKGGLRPKDLWLSMKNRSN